MLSLDSGLSKGDKPSATVAQLSEDRNNIRVFRLIQLSVPCFDYYRSFRLASSIYRVWISSTNCGIESTTAGHAEVVWCLLYRPNSLVLSDRSAFPPGVLVAKVGGCPPLAIKLMEGASHGLANANLKIMIRKKNSDETQY